MNHSQLQNRHDLMKERTFSNVIKCIKSDMSKLDRVHQISEQKLKPINSARRIKHETNKGVFYI